MSGYTKAEMERVRKAVAEAVPGAIFTEGDYGWALGVCNAGRTKAATLFEILYEQKDNGDLHVVGYHKTALKDVPKIVEALTP